jgi:hypothetical protein
LVFSSVGDSNTSREALISKYNRRGRGAYRGGGFLTEQAGAGRRRPSWSVSRGGRAMSFLVGEQGRQLHESRGRRASARAGRKRRVRAGLARHVLSFFPRALLFYHALSLSFLLPRALSVFPARTLPCSPFFLPAPALGRLNCARGDASRHFTGQGDAIFTEIRAPPTPKRRITTRANLISFAAVALPCLVFFIGLLDHDWVILTCKI